MEGRDGKRSGRTPSMGPRRRVIRRQDVSIRSTEQVKNGKMLRCQGRYGSWRPSWSLLPVRGPVETGRRQPSVPEDYHEPSSNTKRSLRHAARSRAAGDGRGRAAWRPRTVAPPTGRRPTTGDGGDPASTSGGQGRAPGEDQRLLSMNAASWLFEAAPTFVASTLPFLNSISVGMPRIP